MNFFKRLLFSAILVLTPSIALAQNPVTIYPNTGSPGDAESNTSTSLGRVGEYGFMYNGTTWDRLRGDTTNGIWVNVKNSVALAVTQSTSPWVTSDNHFPSTQALADNLSNPTVTGIGSYNLIWDSTNTQWRRMLATASGLTRVSLDGATAPINNSQISASYLNTYIANLPQLQNGATGNGNGTSVDGLGATAIAVNIQCTVACSGGTTMSFQVSMDNSNFVAAFALQVGTNTIVTSVTPNDGTERWYILPLSPYRYFRVPISAYSAGTITVNQSTTAGIAAYMTTNTNVVNIPAVTQSGSNWSSNVAQFGGNAVVTGTGASGSGIPRITLSNDSSLAANQSINNNQWNGQALASPDANSYVISPTAATATAAAAASVCNILSAVSTNATLCKNAAGNLYGFEVYNTTTTVYYLRLYNLSAAPTCSSATGFIRTIPIQPAAAAGGVGGEIDNFTVPVNFSTGIGYCITGGSSSTDNTNAATGIFGELKYK